MFDHVTIRVSDRAASAAFYDLAFASLGRPRTSEVAFDEWDDFSIAGADAVTPPTRRLHVGFAAESRDQVDRFHATMLGAGHRDDGAPGPRPQYRDDYYGAFVLDPDGNSVEAVHHGALRGGAIDHLWLRVADLAAARAFYERVAPHAGFRLNTAADELVQFVGAGGSFSLVPGEPTERVHLAFPAARDEAVDRFHAHLVGAGYRDHGAPGERPVYHPGYYGAFVLDPDGNNVELVNHNRPA